MPMLEESRGPIWIVTGTALAPGVTSAFDVFDIVASTSSRCVIRELEIGQYSVAGDANAEMVGLQILRNHNTAGSGGAAISATGSSPNACNVRQLFSPNGTSAIAAQITPATPGFTGKIGNNALATNATSNNAVDTLRATSFNAMGGYRYYPGARGERWIIDFGQRFVVRMQAQTVTALYNATILVQEVGNGDV